MNSYQLISKLKKVRDDTYLTTSAQALYYELISICNETKWKDIFKKKNADLCNILNMAEKTLIKSRTDLSDAGLIYFQSTKDKRIGCYYSFTTVISSVYFTGESTDDSTDESSDDSIGIGSSSSVETPVECLDDNLASSELSSVKYLDETQIPPIIDMKTKNNRESLALTHEPPPPRKPKTSRKKEGDEKPLVYPFTSIAFMATWETLRNTPKWKKKLNYAMQLSLNKLGQFEEAFAIEQMERAIESNWTGVVFSETDRIYQEWLNRKHGKSISTTKSANSSSTANERKESVEGLADLAEGVLQGIGAEKFK